MSNVKKLFLAGAIVAALCLPASAIFITSAANDQISDNTQIVLTEFLGTCFNLSNCKSARDGQVTQQACWNANGISWKSAETGLCENNPNPE